MAVSIAEYLGQRTDSDGSIIPVDVPPSSLAMIPLCPFNNQLCSKISKGFRDSGNPQNADVDNMQSKHPVCSLRKYDSTHYIVCEDRLLSSSTSQISDYQKEMLLQTAQALFNSSIGYAQVGY